MRAALIVLLIPVLVGLGYLVGCRSDRMNLTSGSGRTPTAETPRTPRVPENAVGLAQQLALRGGSQSATQGWQLAAIDDLHHGWRWRHPGVERLTTALHRATRQERQAYMLVVQVTSDATTAAQGTIAAARVGHPSAVAQLPQWIDRSEIGAATRCAALETWAMSRADQASQDVRRRIDRSMESGEISEQPLVAESLRYLALVATVDEEPRFGRALSSPAHEVQLAALEAWQVPGASVPPFAISTLLQSPVPEVREGALLALAQRPRADMSESIQAMFADPDPSVQAATAKALVGLGSPAALQYVERMADSRSEMIRVAVASALADAGFHDRVYGFQDDGSWRVRREVARALRYDDRPLAGDLANRLLADRSVMVQTSVVDAVADWDKPRRGPVLLAGLSSPALETRQSAQTQLARHWPAAARFPAEASAAARTPIVAQLQQDWTRRQLGQPDSATPGMLEPRLLRELQDLDAPARAARLQELQDGLRQAEIDDETGQRVSRLLQQWDDPAAWSAVLAVVDRRPATWNWAAVALNSGHTEVRQDALQKIHQHVPGFSQPLVNRLLELCDDPDSETATLALRTVGRQQTPQVSARLATALQSPDRKQRLAAALVLCRQGQPSGWETLRRLALDPSVDVRRTLAKDLQAYPELATAPWLVAMLDDRAEVRWAALKTLDDWSREGHLPPVARPIDPASQRIAGWRVWSRQQGDLPRQVVPASFDAAPGRPARLANPGLSPSIPPR